ncbi:hypothetical protein BLNAU_3954 [Blattamonas nauphoetae]|uniref:Uncharacterized protein n=1 Tax=Blattamonas nauphoetae TaxID=2049346 RepID=A0ABQ9YBN1_9EUKA|nr:hypothetical protein BLNAU_3954 [Blattamonas nauphoetae]
MSGGAIVRTEGCAVRPRTALISEVKQIRRNNGWDQNWRREHTTIPKSHGVVAGGADSHHTTYPSELLLDRAPSLTHPRLLALPIPGIMQRKQVNSCSIVPPPSLIPDCELLLDRAPSLTHPRLLALPIPGIMQRKQVNSCSIVPPPSLIPDCELLLDRAPSLTHPRLLALPIPGIMQRKQVNSCSIVPLPHSSPIVGVADPWHYAAQTGELLLDRAPPSLIPDCWRCRSLALCSANR